MEQNAVKVSTFQQRITELLDESIQPAADLAKALHVSRQTLSAWKTGVRSPKEPTILSIADYFCVDELWLMGFNVPKYKRKRMYVNDSAPDAVRQDDNDIRVLIPGMDKLPEQQRERIINIFRAVFEATYPDLEKKGSENDDT